MSLHSQRAEDCHQILAAIETLQNEVRSVKANSLKDPQSALPNTELGQLATRVSKLAYDEAQFKWQTPFLESLHYDRRQNRYDAIPKAYESTFEWAFSEGNPLAVFPQWLRTGSGTFFVTGKPGAGKSTLMKFIVRSTRTKELLLEWSQQKRVVIASHYFWSAGAPIQRSQEGLLRSLLYEILARAPELAPALYKTKWETMKCGPRTQWSDYWTLDELQECLARIAKFPELPVKVCLFIDGLDEFDGDSLALCKTIHNLCDSPDIKACVASRPWNVFKDFFGGHRERTLSVNELTQRDIMSYAASRLFEHPRWNTTVSQVPEASKLSERISARAESVFLWVFLVTRELREGLTNGDSWSDLQRRLESIPTDLESFFKHILDSVDPFYHEKMATSLLLAVYIPQPRLSVELYAFHDLEHDDKQYALKRPIRALEDSEWDEFLQPVERRLNGRCKGLLEIKRDPVDGDTLQFLHRTVYDFLRTSQVAGWLREKTKPSFNPFASAIRSYLAWVKSSQYRLIHPHPDQSEYAPIDNKWQLLYDLTWFARQLNSSESVFIQEHFDDLEMTLIEMAEAERDADIGHQDNPSIWFRQMMVTEGLVDYISIKLSEDSSYFAGLASSPLALFLLKYRTRVNSSGADFASPRTTIRKMVKCLVQHGFPINEAFSGGCSVDTLSPWVMLLQELMSPGELDILLIREHALILTLTEKIQDGAFTILLQHGADSNAHVPIPEPPNRSQMQINQHPYLTAWSVWLLLVLENWGTSEILSEEEEYISIFKTMLVSGVDLDIMDTKVFKYTTGGLKPLTKTTPWQYLVTTLKCDAKNRNNYRHPRGANMARRQQFLFMMLKEFATYAGKERFPWADIQPALSVLLPPRLWKDLAKVMGLEG